MSNTQDNSYVEFVKNVDLNGFNVDGCIVQATDVQGVSVYFDIYSSGKMDGEPCVYKMECEYDTETGSISVLENDIEQIGIYDDENIYPPDGSMWGDPVYVTSDSDDIRHFDNVMEKIADRLENGREEFFARDDYAENGTDKQQFSEISYTVELAKPSVSITKFEELIKVIDGVAQRLDNQDASFNENDPSITEKLQEIFGEVYDYTPIAVSGWIEGVTPHYEIYMDGKVCYDSKEENIKALCDAYNEYDYNAPDKDVIDYDNIPDDNTEDVIDLSDVPVNLIIDENTPEAVTQDYIDREEGFVVEEPEDNMTAEQNIPDSESSQKNITMGTYLNSEAAGVFSEGTLEIVRSGYIPVESRIGRNPDFTQEKVDEFRQDIPDFGRYLGFDTTNANHLNLYNVSSNDMGRVCDAMFNGADGKYEIGTYGAEAVKEYISLRPDEIQSMKLYVDRVATGGVKQFPVDTEGKALRGDISKLSDNEVCYKISDRGTDEIVPLSDIKEGHFGEKGYYTAINEKGGVDVFRDTRINTVKIDGARIETYTLCSVEVMDKTGHIFKDTCLLDAKGGVVSSGNIPINDNPAKGMSTENRLFIKAGASIPVLDQFDAGSYNKIHVSEGIDRGDIREKYELGGYEDKSFRRAAAISSSDIKGRMDRIDNLIESKTNARDTLERTANFKELAREISLTSLSEKTEDIANLIKDIDKGSNTESPENIDAMKKELTGKIEGYHREYDAVRPDQSLFCSSILIAQVQGLNAEISHLEDTKAHYTDYLEDAKTSSPRNKMDSIAKLEAESIDRGVIETRLENFESFIVTDEERALAEEIVDDYNKDLPDNEKVSVEKDGIYTTDGLSIKASNPDLISPDYEKDSERQTENLYSKEYDSTGRGDDFKNDINTIHDGENKTPVEKSHNAGVSIVSEHARARIASPVDIIPNIIDSNCYDPELKKELNSLNDTVIKDIGVSYVKEEDIEKNSSDSQATSDNARSIDQPVDNGKQTDIAKYERGSNITLDKFLKASVGSYARIDRDKAVELSDRAKGDILRRAEVEAKNPDTGKIDEAKKEELIEKYTSEKIKELEVIKEKIVKGLDCHNKHSEYVPRLAQRTDTPLTIDNFIVDKNAYDYIRAGGRFGEGCFLKNGVTSANVVSDLVMIKNSNLITSIEWRIIGAVTSGIEKIIYGEVIGKDPIDTERDDTDKKDPDDKAFIDNESDNDGTKEKEVVNDDEASRVETNEEDKPQDTEMTEDSKSQDVEKLEDDPANIVDSAAENSTAEQEDITLDQNSETKDVADNTKATEDVIDNSEKEQIEETEQSDREDASQQKMEEENEKSDVANMGDLIHDIPTDDGEDGEEDIEATDKESKTDDTEEDDDKFQDNDVDKDHENEDMFDNVEFTDNDHQSEYDNSEISTEDTVSTGAAGSMDNQDNGQNVADAAADMEGQTGMNDTPTLEDISSNMEGTDGFSPDDLTDYEYFSASDRDIQTELPDPKQDSFWQYEDGRIPSQEEMEIQSIIDEAVLADRDMLDSEPTGEIDGMEFTQADMDYVLNGGTMDTGIDAEWNNEWQAEADRQLHDVLNDSMDIMSNGIDDLLQEVEAYIPDDTATDNHDYFASEETLENRMDNNDIPENLIETVNGSLFDEETAEAVTGLL